MRHSIPVQQLLLRAQKAERANPSPELGNLVGMLVDRLTEVVDALDGQSLWSEAFTPLATAVDVAEALAAGRPE